MTDSNPSLMTRVLRGKQESTLIQLVRYFFVGGLAFGLDMGILVFLTEVVGLHYLISALFGFGAGLTLNYLLSIRWVFDQRTVKSKGGEFALFAAIGAAGLGLNELLLWLGTDVAGLHYTLSKVGATVVVFGFNFTVRKALLFTRR